MEVGLQLSEARQRQNLTLADISRTTKIPVHLLEAIERNDIDHLPQGFFTRAFVRAYAKEVGVDAELLVNSIEESEVERVPIEHPAANVPIDERHSSRSFVAVAALCAACAVYYSGFASKTGAPETPPVAVASTTQPLPQAAVVAAAIPPCVAAPPPVVTVTAARRAPLPPKENLATVSSEPEPAPVPVIHQIAADETVISAPAEEPSATRPEL